MNLTVNELINILKPLNKIKPENKYQMPIIGISTDSRNIQANEVFLAIKGEKFNGHDFLKPAIEKKAAAVIIEQDVKLTHHVSAVLQVKDTLKALSDIAGYYRAKFNIPLVAVTGSNGKTTTKEMTAQVLGVKFNVLKNIGSENNHIGLPMTLLRLDSTYQACVVEMGMNHPGEIRNLSNIAKPEVAVITNVGYSHLQFMDNLENIACAKCEILENLSNNGTVVVNGDDEILLKHVRKSSNKLITFGVNCPADFHAESVKQGIEGVSFLLNKKLKIELPVFGIGNVYNALAAISVGQIYGIELKDMQTALAKVKLPKLRMQVFDFLGAKVIADCYNANPVSVKLAIDTLKNINGFNRRVAIIGDMLELGRYGLNFHRQIGKLVAGANIDVLIAVGDFSKDVINAAGASGMKKNISAYCDIDALKNELSGLIKENDIILLKGSRKMQMEKLLQCSTTCSTR